MRILNEPCPKNKKPPCSVGDNIPNRKFSGFTIIELTIVVVTLALVFSFGYANYRGFQRRRYLESAVRTLASDLKSARSKAVTSVKPGIAPCDANILTGYYFQRIDQFSYEIFASCGGWANIISVKGAVTLPANIEIQPIGLGEMFYFKSLGNGIDRNVDVNIVLNLVNNAGAVLHSQDIIVTPAGEIRAP